MEKIKKLRSDIAHSDSLFFSFLRSGASSQAASWVDLSLGFALFAWLGLAPWLSAAVGALCGGAVEAVGAMELWDMSRKAGLTTEEGLRVLRDAGMEAIPGGGAEIFDEEVRSRICPDKGSTAEWFDVHRTAHRMGLRTNCTILYGHVERVEHRIDHLDRLRALQDETRGFDAFIPLKYRSFGNPMSEIGEVSVTEDLRMLALSRLYLDNIPHIKAYWVMYGRETAELALAFGADDIDGTIDDTTKIYSMAGGDRRPVMTEEQMHRMAVAAGYRAVERDTHYNEL